MILSSNEEVSLCFSLETSQGTSHAGLISSAVQASVHARRMPNRKSFPKEIQRLTDKIISRVKSTVSGPMIELTGDIQHLLRNVRKEATITVQRTQATSAVTLRSGGREAPAGATSRGTGEGQSPGAKGYSSVINFQLLPSGKLQLNEEERQYIIDFFE